MEKNQQIRQKKIILPCGRLDWDKGILRMNHSVSEVRNYIFAKAVMVCILGMLTGGSKRLRSETKLDNSPSNENIYLYILEDISE